MASSNDQENFESYRLQTQVKHQILSDYLPAFYEVLKGYRERLGFIDAFAGRGSYDADDGKVPGSPIRALKIISDKPAFRGKVRAAFIEKDDTLVEALRDEVEAFRKHHPEVSAPLILPGEFAQQVEAALAHIGPGAATFAFIDPCGVRGTSFDAIRRIMENDAHEAFVFFNIDGLRRTAGLVDQSDVIEEVLGSKEEASKVHAKFQAIDNADEREQYLLGAYRDVVREKMGVDFFLPFGVEAEKRQLTSHYLIHLTKNKTGFRIMKDVMWKHGRSSEGGGLFLQQRSDLGMAALFTPRDDGIREHVLEEMQDLKVRVSDICRGWAERPSDFVSSSAYKKALKDLEYSGQLVVLDEKDMPVPASQRRKDTLADHLFVRRR